MKIARLAFAVALSALVFPAAAQDATNATGVWQSESGITRVRVSQCGNALCGVVVWQKNPGKDVHNPDPAKRERPIVGLQLVSGMKQTAPDEWTGSIYNYEDGKTYSGKVKLAGATSLQIGGCVMGGIICQSRTWRKVQ